MEVFQAIVKRFRLNKRRFSRILALFLISIPVILIIMMMYQEEPTLNSNDTVSNSDEGRTQNVTQLIAEELLSTEELLDTEVSVVPHITSSKNGSSCSFSSSSTSTTTSKDKLLGGLLSSEFDKRSCLSRYKFSSYHKTSPHKPSSYLLSKLRSYEHLHKRCGPNTKPYNTALRQLKSGSKTKIISTECNYVVWVTYSGLGNRMLTIASAFVYALLTNRVLLIDQEPDMVDLFCEPFPDTSWLLPVSFPLKKKFSSFDQKYGYSFGNSIKKNVKNSSKEFLVMSLYVHLTHDYDDHDKLFFCDEEQVFLRKVPWLIMRTDNYFVPSLFLMPSFEQELIKLFPNKETIFHHLGRYLFHPTNQVWGLVTRYYQAYLEKANERIGIQIRVFDHQKSPFQNVMEQLLSCALKEKLLPEVDMKRYVSDDDDDDDDGEVQISKAVLITTLYSGYFEKLRDMYWTHPTVTGEVIGVYQPSIEEHQKQGDNLHNMKAWAEMYLLSMCDVLVTSAWSTFGYVAQGLGGLKPWILYKIEDRKTPNPPCGRVMSMEPCFHAPPFYDCKAKSNADTGAMVPHVRHCEDISWGLKLFDSPQ